MSASRRLSAAVPLVAVALLLSACGIDTSGGSAGGSTAGSSVAPDISSVEPPADPREFQGVVSPLVDETDIDPVVEDPEPELPAVVTDAQGNKVTVTDTSRVLALDLYGTLSRTVFELGLGDRLVGRDTSTRFEQAADLPLVTPKGHDLSAEAILDLDPTVIISDTTLGPVDVLHQMEEAGIPVVWVESDRNLGNVGELTRMTAAALGVPEAGTLLADRIEAEVKEVTAKIAAKAPADPTDRLRTVFLYVRGTAGVYYMFGQGSGADDLIDAVGAYDVAEEIKWKGMRPVTAEGLVAAAPELVVMMTGGLESTGGVDGLLEKLPALAQTSAGRNKRIVTIDDSLILGYGPNTADVLNALAVAVIAPEALT
ncbi:heme/hemin ABC transporter substrate-binding protein [Nocardioides jishulii]|uniref:Hemin receptor n=1 Tax=Nocardioides jishulii TaxID=2575440 RepID=A0A4U2YIK5_9ACTN|nr:ABC transporter substrate-binding protein [Nocardioides jishulii]QCX28272.1 hemin receptor [Nocardioides jishulii]TKI60936.1 hemin receptor [Nocardioides jishulii]